MSSFDVTCGLPIDRLANTNAMIANTQINEKKTIDSRPKRVEVVTSHPRFLPLRQLLTRTLPQWTLPDEGGPPEPRSEHA